MNIEVLLVRTDLEQEWFLSSNIVEVSHIRHDELWLLIVQLWIVCD